MLTLNWAPKALKAVEKLITQYETGKHTGLWKDCSLCQEFDSDKKENCSACPWVIFEGHPCVFNCADKYYDYKRDLFQKRLLRLFTWRDMLKDIIKTGRTPHEYGLQHGYTMLKAIDIKLCP